MLSRDTRMTFEQFGRRVVAAAEQADRIVAMGVSPEVVVLLDEYLNLVMASYDQGTGKFYDADGMPVK